MAGLFDWMFGRAEKAPSSRAEMRELAARRRDAKATWVDADADGSSETFAAASSAGTVAALSAALVAAGTARDAEATSPPPPPAQPAKSETDETALRFDLDGAPGDSGGGAEAAGGE